MAHDIVAANKTLGVRRLLGPVVMIPMMLEACTTSSHVLLGRTRTALQAADVRVYLEPLTGSYETIAVVAASSRRSWSWTAEAQAEVVMDRLKAEAAKLGANAIVLGEISTGGAASGGVDVAPDVTREHASIGVGFDATSLLGSRQGRAVAIYVPPPETALPGR